MRYEIHISHWLPTTFNVLLRMHWAKRNRVVAGEKQMVAVYGYNAKIPKAEGKRRVSLVWTLGKNSKRIDPDAGWKNILDGLRDCRLLKDDSAEWCELGGITFNRAADKAITIILEDI